MKPKVGKKGGGENKAALLSRHIHKGVLRTPLETADDLVGSSHREGRILNSTGFSPSAQGDGVLPTEKAVHLSHRAGQRHRGCDGCGCCVSSESLCPRSHAHVPHADTWPLPRCPLRVCEFVTEVAALSSAAGGGAVQSGGSPLSLSHCPTPPCTGPGWSGRSAGASLHSRSRR